TRAHRRTSVPADDGDAFSDVVAIGRERAGAAGAAGGRHGAARTGVTAEAAPPARARASDGRGIWLPPEEKDVLERSIVQGGGAGPAAPHVPESVVIAPSRT